MSEEEQTQRKRESSIFQSIYMNPNMIPQNPIRELDELYVKDDKVLLSDCGEIAAEFFKQRDDENFKKEMEALQEELKLLDEGKYSRQDFTPSMARSVSSHTRGAGCTSLRDSSFRLSSLLTGALDPSPRSAVVS